MARTRKLRQRREMTSFRSKFERWPALACTHSATPPINKNVLHFLASFSLTSGVTLFLLSCLSFGPILVFTLSHFLLHFQNVTISFLFLQFSFFRGRSSNVDDSELMKANQFSAEKSCFFFLFLVQSSFGHKKPLRSQQAVKPL